MRFFSSLYRVLRRGGRAVLQFYPETPEQAVLISECATAVGFAGGVVVDYPNSTKAKKHYLVLSFDRNSSNSSNSKQQQQSVLEGGLMSRGGVRVDKDDDDPLKGKKKRPPPKKKKGVKTKEWIVHKKQTQRKRGKKVRPDTKYTARRRPTKF